MDLDDDICQCYHVSLRKLLNFARRERPAHASQMSQCLGAGTGCGWCIPLLAQIAQSVRDAHPPALAGTLAESQEARKRYREARAATGVARVEPRDPDPSTSPEANA